jgi:hypothetical protein
MINFSHISVSSFIKNHPVATRVIRDVSIALCIIGLIGYIFKNRLPLFKGNKKADQPGTEPKLDFQPLLPQTSNLLKAVLDQMLAGAEDEYTIERKLEEVYSFIHYSFKHEDFWNVIVYCTHFSSLCGQLTKKTEDEVHPNFESVNYFWHQALSNFLSDKVDSPTMTGNQTIKEKNDGNCGVNTVIDFLRYTFIIRGNGQEIPPKLGRILQKLEIRYPRKKERFLASTLLSNGSTETIAESKLKTLLFGSRSEAGQIIREIIAKEYMNHKDDESTQLGLDNSIVQDLGADLDYIMGEIATYKAINSQTEDNQTEEPVQKTLKNQILQLPGMSRGGQLSDEDRKKLAANSLPNKDGIEISLEKTRALLNKIKALIKDKPLLINLPARTWLADYTTNYKTFIANPNKQDMKEQYIQNLFDQRKDEARKNYLEKIQKDGIWLQQQEHILLSNFFEYNVCIIKKDKLSAQEIAQVHEAITNNSSPNILNLNIITFPEDKKFEHWLYIHHGSNGSHFEPIFPVARVKQNGTY